MMQAPGMGSERVLAVVYNDILRDARVRRITEELASRYEPEDLRTIVRAYQDTCAGVVARLEGSNPGGKAVLLMAHYDSVPAGPGAGDDLSGVAAILEAARALKAGPPPANPVPDPPVVGTQVFLANIERLEGKVDSPQAKLPLKLTRLMLRRGDTQTRSATTHVIICHFEGLSRQSWDLPNAC